MAGEDDGKTEDPTGKKLGEACNKGMVGKSGDFSSSLVMLSGVAMIYLFSDKLVMGMRNTMVESFMAIGNFEQIPGMLFSLARQGLVGILMLILPVVCGITAVSLTASVAQV